MVSVLINGLSTGIVDKYICKEIVIGVVLDAFISVCTVSINTLFIKFA